MIFLNLIFRSVSLLAPELLHFDLECGFYTEFPAWNQLEMSQVLISMTKYGETSVFSMFFI